MDKNKNKATTQQVVEIAKEEVEKEIELTEEEKRLLKYLKYKIKDLKDFGELARLIHWFNDNYELGQIVNAEDLPLLKLFNTKKDSFLIFSDSGVVALSFDVRYKSDNKLISFSLSNIKPLSKYLESLRINILFPYEEIYKLLTNYVDENKAKELTDKIKKMLELPCFVSSEFGDEVIMLIAPVVSD